MGQINAFTGKRALGCHITSSELKSIKDEAMSRDVHLQSSADRVKATWQLGSWKQLGNYRSRQLLIVIELFKWN